MSDEVNEWTFCTEHRKAVDGGSCPECNGDRNLVQVVRRYYLDVARNQVDAMLEGLTMLRRSVRMIEGGNCCDGADAVTSDEGKAFIKELWTYLERFEEPDDGREDPREVGYPRGT